MERISFQINELQSQLTTVSLGIEYRDVIYENRDLAKKYVALTFIYRRLIESSILTMAVLVSEKDEFNCLKPYKVIEGDKTIRDKLDKSKFDKIMSHKKELEKILGTDIVKNLKTVRDQFIAHNDLLKRENMNIDLMELRKLIKDIRIIYNETSFLLNIPLFPMNSGKHNSIDPLIQKLKN